MKEYDHQKIEKKWQKKWKEEEIYKTKEDPDKPKCYVLDMFPYPSGEGLHVGHPKGYIATDVYSRHKRMTGHNVLHPMGWDAFGLPAENFAIKNKIHPRVAVEKNIARFKEQLSNISFDYDWDREINTTDPEYYRWTQWIFLKLFERGLAYESHEPINWCPSCQTGLANEDLENGVCERCGSEVELRPMRQWVLRITKYADRLLEDLDYLPKWPEHIKEMQRNWIGRSEGAKFLFKLNNIKGQKDGEHSVEVFTTRPDTFFGVTFLVISPEKAEEWMRIGWDASSEVREYVEKALNTSELQRQENKEKTGVDTGIRAVHPATNEEIPVWVADYVLGGYGTGAIMAVPAHDERDYEFAKKFDLPIKQVVALECGIPNDEADEKQGGVAVIYNPVTNKIAVARHISGELRLYGGGVSNEEGVQEGILREVEEESGFHNFSRVENLFTCYVHYYNVVKDVHRKGRGTCLLLVLEDDAQKELKLEKHEKYEMEWVTPNELSDHWSSRNSKSDYDHWLLFLELAVKRLQELGFKIEGKVGANRVFSDEGILVDSDEYSGLASAEAGEKIAQKYGERAVTYRLQDWVFSRQRYWGEPIPLIHCEECGVVPVPESDLPVRLPEVEAYEPTGTGESPLALIEEWVSTTCPKCGGVGKRETNTMPQWAGSCWYYLRYMDPENGIVLVDPEREKYWAPVDLYVGGAEHATRHLIYARFWHKFLFDIGVVSTPEPFMELHSVGLIMAEDGRKMSKRYGNVVNPDDVVERFGADTLRTYEMFMGPFENTIAWSTDNMIGTRRFIERVYRLHERVVDGNVNAVERILHKTIKKVGEDIALFKFNTAISQMMIFINEVERVGEIGKEQFATFLKLLAPFAPHVTEELWEQLEYPFSIHLSEWPGYDEALLVDEEIVIAVQVDGKVRGEITISAEIGQEEIEEMARKSAAHKWLEGKEVAKVIYVPKRLINFVTQ